METQEVPEKWVWMDAYDNVSTNTVNRGEDTGMGYKNRYSEVVFWWEDSEVTSETV
jgi:hypothetical protein